jgi:YebC/PmpR family DNA-binding regulatory protein
MSGHSKWATTKHKKAAIDAKRGKLFAKLVKNIEIAARSGGGDVNGNAALFEAVNKAKKNSVPADNIKRAIKRGSGAEAGGANYEDITYEAYGPNGVGIIINCLTDNKNRAAADVRTTLNKNGGSLASSGSVAFNFERKGEIEVPSENTDYDKLFEAAANAGAEDVRDEGDEYVVVTDPSDLQSVTKALTDAGFDHDSSESVMDPKSEVSLDLEGAKKVTRLLDALDDLDDVQNLYSNWTASDDVKAQLDSDED